MFLRDWWSRVTCTVLLLRNQNVYRAGEVYSDSLLKDHIQIQAAVNRNGVLFPFNPTTALGC